uniref:Uncharacterized protein n=1 Tax=Ipomoea trifida TaxID=35884 RepID=A0A920_IPOTF|nr:hypothetical protein [Ipomoea trifida]
MATHATRFLRCFVFICKITKLINTDHHFSVTINIFLFGVRILIEPMYKQFEEEWDRIRNLQRASRYPHFAFMHASLEFMEKYVNAARNTSQKQQVTLLERQNVKTFTQLDLRCTSTLGCLIGYDDN